MSSASVADDAVAEPSRHESQHRVSMRRVTSFGSTMSTRRPSASAGSMVVAPVRNLFRRRLLQRQDHAERRARADAALHLDLAAHRLDESLADGEAQARAAVHARGGGVRPG